MVKYNAAMKLSFAVALVFLGLAGILTFRYFQVKNSPAFAPQPSSFTLSPPSQAITAALSESAGVVEQFTREADDYQEATPGGAIRQGESIATKRGSAVIALDTLGSVSMGDNSEMSFVSLIPTSLVVWQKSGTVAYEVNASDPFSIRALHALITLSGDASLAIDGTDILFRVTKGTAKLALVDTDNNTNVWNIVEGQRAIVDDEARSVRLRK